MAGERQRGHIYVGTSGYVYPHWRGVFYPQGLRIADWLAFYARHFGTVEVNATFYRLPSARAVEGWRTRVPRTFRFACKGSRFLTHVKRLLDHRCGLRRFFAPLKRLEERLAVVLWQLPPQMARVDAGRLDAFLEALPAGPRYAMEFRDPAWHTAEVWRLLERHAAALCEHDLLTPPHAAGGRVPLSALPRSGRALRGTIRR